MSIRRIRLSDEAVNRSLTECAADPVFQRAFGRTLDLFAAQATAHEGSRPAQDVSAQDVEAQLLREFYKITILARLEKLANGELGQRFVTGSNEVDGE